MPHKPRPPRRPTAPPSDTAQGISAEHAAALENAGIALHPLTGELGTTLEAILSASALLDETFAASGMDEAPPDLLAEIDEDVVPIALSMRVLARSLLASALGRPPGRPRPRITPTARPISGVIGSIDALRAGDGVAPVHGLATALGPHSSIDPRALDELARALLPKNLPRSVRPSPARRERALADAERLLREVGLEEFDVSCHLVLARDDTPTLAAAAVPPETAHVWLIESLFERAEVAAFGGEPLLAVERDASRWEFACWSADPARVEAESGSDFAQGVREQEYSLVDRVTLALDASVLGDLAGGDEFLELYPRQHRLAQSLLASFTGVFECEAIDGDRATFRSLSDDRRYTVHEHVIPPAYAPGAIGFGRLLPFDGASHLRSPGMVIVSGTEPELPAMVARTLREIGDAIPPALAIEGLISTFVFGEAVPRVVKPSSSRAVARELVTMIEEILDEAELEREVSPTEAPAELRAQVEEVPGVRYVSFALDSTLSEYLIALAEQADGGGRRAATGTRRKTPKATPGKAKGKKRRRR